jgi:hypothetical protein
LSKVIKAIIYHVISYIAHASSSSKRNIVNVLEAYTFPKKI